VSEIITIAAYNFLKLHA